MNEHECAMHDLGGFPIAELPLEAGGNGDYETIDDFFSLLTDEQRDSYARIAYVAFDPPEPEAYMLDMFGFNPIEYSHYLVRGIETIDPERTSEGARLHMEEQLDSLETWITLQAEATQPPILGLHTKDEHIVDSAQIAWFRSPSDMQYGMNNPAAAGKSLRAITQARELVYDPSSHSGLLTRILAAANG